VLTKELANTYKRIKMYEYEIGKLEEANKSVTISQKSNQVDSMVKEKRSLADKLKAKLVKEQRLVQDNIRRLEKHNQKEEIEHHVKKMADEANFFKEQCKVIEQREAMKASNMKKQYDAIKKHEAELLEGGLAAGELEAIKRNAFSSITHSARKTMQQKEDLLSGSEEEVEDRTRDHFQALLA
jgi:hypothetical protein